MFRPTFFSLKELVWESIYNRYKNKEWILWRKFDRNFLIVADKLRINWGACYFNTWSLTLPIQKRQYAGARPHVRPKNEKWSNNTTHKDWNSGDVIFGDLIGLPREKKIAKYKERYNYILEHPGEFPEITVLEDIKKTKTYIHFSTGNFDDEGKIRVVKP